MRNAPKSALDLQTVLQRIKHRFSHCRCSRVLFVCYGIGGADLRNSHEAQSQDGMPGGCLLHGSAIYSVLTISTTMPIAMDNTDCPGTIGCFLHGFCSGAHAVMKGLR